MRSYEKINYVLSTVSYCPLFFQHFPSFQDIKKMPNQHTDVSIAQIIFYVPVILAAASLLFCRKATRGLPRFTWIVLVLFTISTFLL